MDVTQKATIQKKQHEIKESLEASDFLDRLFFHTLPNFAYRYFEEGSALKTNVFKEHQTYYCQYQSTSLIEALKSQNKNTKDKIIKFAKAYGGQKAIQIDYELKGHIDHGPQDSGHVTLSAQIVFSSPESPEEVLLQILEQKQFSYEDSLDLRNNLANYLEEVCEVF